MKNLFLTAFILVCMTASSQVKIGSNPTIVNSDAGLELESAGKGLLLPRVELTSTTSAAPLSEHIQGMLVHNTANVNDVVAGMYVNDGIKWNQVFGSDSGATVTAICNGFAGTYMLGAGLRTYTVTYTNNSFSAVTITPLVSDLVLTPASGLNVASVSPAVTTSIASGDSLTVTYNLSGNITAASGTVITGTYTKLGIKCSATVAVQFPYTTVSGTGGTTITLMAHNLGADYTLNPHVPVEAIYGNYYSWGRINPVANAATPAAAITGWNTTAAANGSWKDESKTANDPCPSGFRVPTMAQWTDIVNNNTFTNIGSWVTGPTNFGTAKQVVVDGITKLTLPIGGYRNNTAGILYGRGGIGYYWASTEYGINARNLYMINNIVDPANNSIRTNGFFVRCIKE